MAETQLSVTEAVEAARNLDALIEERIDLALTPAVKAQLAARGISEAAARIHLRMRATESLLAAYSH